MQSKPPPFRVLIADGGIAGLTLANCLQHAGIDYLLIEARNELVPQLGASIGLGPNGSRILDQLGCYDEIMDCTVPIDYTGSHRPSDGAFIWPKTDAFRLVQARANYCMCFLDRQTVLRILAEHVKDQRKLLLNKRIVRAEEHAKGVTVSCEDGTTYEGDILVGADGVHSVVRRETRRAADSTCPGEIPDQEKGCMLAEYRRIYAISTPIPGLPAREFNVTYKEDVSPIVITSKNGQVYWFLIERMPQVYRYGSIPRFTKADAEAFVEKYLDIALMPDAKVTVRDLWRNCETYNLVPLEEAYYSHWTFGRFVCLGDSVHKMTPNMGAGGNSAIEGAAAIANELHLLLTQNHHSIIAVQTVAIHHALSSYQRTHSVRASATFKASNFVTRLHAVRGLVEYLLVHYIMPNAGDLLVDLASDNWIGSVRLNYLPVPPRSLDGTMPFNPEQGIGKNESLLLRAVAATPFLALSLYGLFLRASHGPASTSLAALMDFGIILMESARRANLLMPMQMPLLFGLGSQYLGAEVAVPLYYYMYYALIPISRFHARDLRLTDLSYTRSVLPVVLMLWHVPVIVTSFTSPTSTTERPARVLKTSPLWISTTQWLLRRSGILPSTIQQDRIDNVARDMPTLHRTAKTLATISTVTWIGMMLSRFVRSPSNTLVVLSSAIQCSSPSKLILNGSSLLWTTYLFRDLKRAGMIGQSWFALLSSLGVSSLCLGPTAAVVAAWAWRETVLATKRHWGALVTSSEAVLGRKPGESTFHDKSEYLEAMDIGRK